MEVHFDVAQNWHEAAHIKAIRCPHKGSKAPQATCGSNSALITFSSSAAVSTRAVAVASAPIITAAVSPGSVMGAGANAFLARRHYCRLRCCHLRCRRRYRCRRRCCHCCRLGTQCCSYLFRHCCRLCCPCLRRRCCRRLQLLLDLPLPLLLASAVQHSADSAAVWPRQC